MSGDSALARLDRQFRFAKTRPWHPHYYVIRTEQNAKDWWLLFHRVQKDGVVELWHQQKFKYLYPGDGWQYWPMVETAEEKPILINWAKIKAESAPSLFDVSGGE